MRRRVTIALGLACVLFGLADGAHRILRGDSFRDVVWYWPPTVAEFIVSLIAAWVLGLAMGTNRSERQWQAWLTDTAERVRPLQGSPPLVCSLPCALCDQPTDAARLALAFPTGLLYFCTSAHRDKWLHDGGRHGAG